MQDFAQFNNLLGKTLFLYFYDLSVFGELFHF